MTVNRQINKVVFLVSWPITERDAKRFGFEILQSKGFQVMVFDLSPIINSAALRLHPVGNALSGDNILKFHSYRDFESMVREVAPEATFIDYIIGLGEFTYKTEKVFRLLKKYNAAYYVISGGALPLAKANEDVRTRYMILLKKLLNPRKVSNFLANKVIQLLRKHADLYAIPAKIFSGDSEVLLSFLQRFQLSRDRQVPIHSLDYDTYLEYQKAPKQVPGEWGNYCVFLDEAATNHPDFAILNIETIDEQTYFKNINAFFDKLEGELGLEVIIAAHPRANYENTPGVFKHRKVIKGKSVDLVANSKLVVLHASTSVSFAILFNKPIIITKTQEMAEKGMGNFIDTLAEVLGTRALCIDDSKAMEAFSAGAILESQNKYDDYLYKYVKSPKVEDLTVWEIVARNMS
ncbi:MAG TPA: hypothetical protein VHS59_11785 [Bacillota bacterium]|nr:hypothetical protein [Bacillota bacterium]